MKHLKYFENNNLTKFRKNNIVTCINSDDDDFFGRVGIVTYADTTCISHNPFCDVRFTVYSEPVFIYDKYLRLSTPEEIEQYNLEKETNKYNL